MKKSLLVVLSILICALTINIANARTTNNSSLASAIKLYKAGNYVQSYTVLNKIVASDPSNAVAHYYLAMSSAQIGKRDEAISSYDKVLSLTSQGQLARYARKGKTCIETPDKCNEPDATESDFDRFVRRHYGSGFSEEARSTYEKQKIENMMREMNRDDSITPQKFKEYKDFSSEVPTNDEIVSAIRVLQQSGLLNNGYGADISLLTGQYNSSNNNYDMINMLMGNRSSSNLSPQVIQSLLTNQMSTSF